MPDPASWGGARRILCVRLDTIGDVLMSTPAIRALRTSGPGRHVTLLTSSPAAPAAELVPEIDDVIVYDPPWMKATAARRDATPDFARIEELRDRRFDAAVIFTVFSQNPLPSAMMCYLADIPLRLAHCHENPYQLLTDWIPDPDASSGMRHEVRRQLDLVATVGATTCEEHLSLRVPHAASERVSELLAEQGILPEDRLAVLHPGATAPSRRWPAARFGAVADRLSAAGVRVALSGTAEERSVAEAAMRGASARIADLTGALGFAELAALVARADVLVTNNTGPAHVAAAVGTPVVDIYALTNLQHTPWQVPSRVLTNPVACAECYSSTCLSGHHHCLSGISVESVVAAVLELLAQTETGAVAGGALDPIAAGTATG